MSKSRIESLKSQVLTRPDRVPDHIAFIMDGNGRWAKRKNLPRLYGHKEGVNSVREMVEMGSELKMKAMTFYTFSTENWKRPAKEVSALMQLLVSTIRKEVKELDENNVTLRTIGCLDDLPEGPRKEFRQAEKTLSGNDGLILTIALSYGGRQEIVRAVNKILHSGVQEVTDKEISAALDTAELPDPDFIIRTSGENRLSNFLLWQCAYSEIFVTDTYWPDFRKAELLEAILNYQNRERRFGKTSEQIKNK